MSNKVHISLDVKDVDRSVRFYEAFFGQPAHKRRPGYANFDLDAPPLKLALNQHERPKGGSLNHMGIVLGTRLGVTEQSYDEPPGDPGLALSSSSPVTRSSPAVRSSVSSARCFPETSPGRTRRSYSSAASRSS